jgi:hypothetical protein
MCKRKNTTNKKQVQSPVDAIKTKTTQSASDVTKKKYAPTKNKNER